MSRAWKLSLTAGVLLLAGCANNPGVFSAPGGITNLYAGLSPDQINACNAAAASKVKSADWSRATTIQVNIRNDLFTPSVLRLRPNQPYRIRFVNADNWFRSFQADDFFQASAIRGMKFGGKGTDVTCTPTVTIGAGSSAEIEILPLKEGRYRWAENPMIFDFAWARGNATGAIVVR